MIKLNLLGNMTAAMQLSADAVCFSSDDSDIGGGGTTGCRSVNITRAEERERRGGGGIGKRGEM
jgi:hypothetical protein